MIAETDVKHLQCFGTVRVLTDAKEKEHARSVFRSKYPEVVASLDMPGLVIMRILPANMVFMDYSKGFEHEGSADV